MYFAECAHLTRNERQIMICCIGVISLVKSSSLEQTHTCQMNIFYVKLRFGASTLWKENRLEKKKKPKSYVMYYAKYFSELIRILMLLSFQHNKQRNNDVAT